MLLRTAVIQVNSRDNPAENLATVEHFLDRAANMGAQFVGLPELWTYLGPGSGFEEAAQTIPGPTIERLQEKARATADPRRSRRWFDEPALLRLGTAHREGCCQLPLGDGF